jgi:hypothetical protein
MFSVTCLAPGSYWGCKTIQGPDGSELSNQTKIRDVYTWMLWIIKHFISRRRKLFHSMQAFLDFFLGPEKTTYMVKYWFVFFVNWNYDCLRMHQLCYNWPWTSLLTHLKLLIEYQIFKAIYLCLQNRPIFQYFEQFHTLAFKWNVKLSHGSER